MTDSRKSSSKKLPTIFDVNKNSDYEDLFAIIFNTEVEKIDWESYEFATFLKNTFTNKLLKLTGRELERLDLAVKMLAKGAPYDILFANPVRGKKPYKLCELVKENNDKTLPTILLGVIEKLFESFKTGKTNIIEKSIDNMLETATYKNNFMPVYAEQLSKWKDRRGRTLHEIAQINGAGFAYAELETTLKDIAKKQKELDEQAAKEEEAGNTANATKETKANAAPIKVPSVTKETKANTAHAKATKKAAKSDHLSLPAIKHKR